MDYKASQTDYHCAICQLHEVRDIYPKQALSKQILNWQNAIFSGTQGISENCRGKGFIPAFLDTHSGISVISRFTNGQPAPVHILDGLPKQWIRSFDKDGAVSTVREGVIAGFMHAGRFYTREEAVIAH